MPRQTSSQQTNSYKKTQRRYLASAECDGGRVSGIEARSRSPTMFISENLGPIFRTRSPGSGRREFTDAKQLAWLCSELYQGMNWDLEATTSLTDRDMDFWPLSPEPASGDDVAPLAADPVRLMSSHTWLPSSESKRSAFNANFQRRHRQHHLHGLAFPVFQNHFQ
jgi:hypothetical protein